MLHLKSPDSHKPQELSETFNIIFCDTLSSHLSEQRTDWTDLHSVSQQLLQYLFVM